jgi:hypothetical protein
VTDGFRQGGRPLHDFRRAVLVRRTRAEWAEVGDGPDVFGIIRMEPRRPAEPDRRVHGRTRLAVLRNALSGAWVVVLQRKNGTTHWLAAGEAGETMPTPDEAHVLHRQLAH